MEGQVSLIVCGGLRVIELKTFFNHINNILELLIIPGASAAGLADVTVSKSCRVAALGEITVWEVGIISWSCFHLSSPAAHPDTKGPGLG